MPPKGRGRPPKQQSGQNNGSQNASGTSNLVDAAKAPSTMSGKRSASNGKRKGKAPSSRNAIPEVYQEMLAEALPNRAEKPERPLKKRRIGPRENQVATSGSANLSDEEDEDDLQFEDVIAANDFDSDAPPKIQQTAYKDSDDESEGDDFDWEGVDFDANLDPGEPSGDLELTLTTKATPQSRKVTQRRKVVSKAERVARLEIHKMHVLCLLSHLDRRNEWCNDSDVHASLKPLLDKKMLTFLSPRPDLSQFSRADSLKRGLEQVSVMWRTKFSITARGMRRALWADDERELQNFRLPDDADAAFEKSDFRAAAKTLKGSRDLGAYLYCALLRSAGVETRLVCSLQPLSFNAGGLAMPRSSAPARKPATPETSDEGELVDIQGPDSPFASSSKPPALGLPFAPRRRLGHPNAADYHMPEIAIPARPPPKPKSKAIIESPYPIFWVEVFDEAHQKWFPVDPLVTETVAKTRAFEPPASDRENSMSYVIAFEEEGYARDVTKRYTKAYNAKTRRNRVESTTGGEKWWRRALKPYRRGFTSDADQIEDTELAAAEAREPMPKNIADFKDHPYYALERHLRRHEVLVSTRECGKVAAGRDPGTPGGKKLEPIYRRKDVKVARSADAWYRLGRDIKMGELPVKIVAGKRRPDDDDDGEDGEERAGTNLYTEDQTELYEAPPVVNGRVPKNSFGNLDVFVSSMVPKGGVHLPYVEASHAARILGIDYSDALTGFEFRGRHGTAVLKGVVVAVEYREAVEAVIEGFRDEQAQAEERRRTLNALRMWKRFLHSLRIKERVDGYDVEGDEPDIVQDDDAESEAPGIVRDEDDDDDDMESDEEYIDDDGGGGFILE